jgi:hypothetical protein
MIESDSSKIEENQLNLFFDRPDYFKITERVKTEEKRKKDWIFLFGSSWFFRLRRLTRNWDIKRKKKIETNCFAKLDPLDSNE